MKYRKKTITSDGWIDSSDAMIPKYNKYIVVRGWSWGDLKDPIKSDDDHDHDSIEITFIKLQFFCDAYCDDDISEEFPVEGAYIVGEKYSCCSEERSDILGKYRYEPFTKRAMAKYFVEPLTFKVNRIDYWIPVPASEPPQWFKSEDMEE